MQTLQTFGYNNFCDNLRKLRTMKGDYLDNFFAEDVPVEEAPKPAPFNPNNSHVGGAGQKLKLVIANPSNDPQYQQEPIVVAPGGNG